MSINLKQFVGQNVIVTSRSGQVHEGRLEANEGLVYPYWLWFEAETDSWSFQEDGRYNEHRFSDRDIVEIRLAGGVLPVGNAIEKVAMALLPDITAALQEDEDLQNLLRQKIERQLDKLLDGGLVDKTFDQVAETLAQNIVVTPKAR